MIVKNADPQAFVNLLLLQLYAINNSLQFPTKLIKLSVIYIALISSTLSRKRISPLILFKNL